MSRSAARGADSPTLEIYLLGLVEYERTARLQHCLVYEVAGADGRLAALVLCEHPPIVTVGRLGSRSQVPSDDAELAEMCLPLRWVNRGGGCTLHVPGQLVAYSVVPLQTMRLGVSEYVRRLEHAVFATLDEFGITASRGAEAGTIWAPAGAIATVGVAVSHGVAYHGATINVGGPTDRFRVLHPDGNGPLRAATIELLRQRPTPMSRVRAAFIRHFQDSLGIERHNLFHTHPMIERKAPQHAHASSLG